MLYLPTLHLLDMLLGAPCFEQSGGPALLFATYNGHIEVSQLLVQHGADINAQDKVVRGS